MLLLLPWWGMLILAFILWAIVMYLFWFKPNIKPKVDDHFAQRRHDRRVRNYANGKTLYDVNTIRKPMVYNAPARRRR